MVATRVAQRREHSPFLVVDPEARHGGKAHLIRSHVSDRQPDRRTLGSEARPAARRIAASWFGADCRIVEKILESPVRLRRDGFAARCSRGSGHVA